MPVVELESADRGKRAIGQVTCPNCRITMRLICMKPVEGEQALREAVYRCPRCDAETTRWISR